MEALAREIVSTDANGEILELARRIAEAQIDLHRARRVRHQLLSEALTDPERRRAGAGSSAPDLRHEQRAVSFG